MRREEFVAVDMSSHRDDGTCANTLAVCVRQERSRIRVARVCTACGGEVWLPSKSTPADCHYCNGTGRVRA
jgi:DnaJ-class molecular chaperone